MPAVDSGWLPLRALPPETVSSCIAVLDLHGMTWGNLDLHGMTWGNLSPLCFESNIQAIRKGSTRVGSTIYLIIHAFQPTSGRPDIFRYLFESSLRAQGVLSRATSAAQTQMLVDAGDVSLTVLGSTQLGAQIAGSQLLARQGQSRCSFMMCNKPVKVSLDT